MTDQVTDASGIAGLISEWRMSLKLLQSPHYTKLNALKRWIKSPGDGRATCNFYALRDAAKKEDKRKITSTHYLMTGYQYVVPAELNDEFLWHMAVSIEQGLLTSAVETRTEYFKYHLDLDFCQSEVVSLQELKPYIQKLQEVLHRFFPFAENAFFECVICSAETKAVTALDGSTQLVKTGYHVFFPYLWVDKDQALDIRSDYLVFLTKAFGVRKQPLKNTWSDVVDEHVYVTSGLRMLASVKAQQCQVCKLRRKKKKNREVPPKIPGLPTKKPQASGRSAPTSTAGSPDGQAMSLSDLRKSLTTSRAILPETSAAPDDVQGSETTHVEKPCPPNCEDGIIMEGRAYFLVAIWDFKGDDVDRKVKVRTTLSTEDTPRFVVPQKAFATAGAGNIPFTTDQAPLLPHKGPGVDVYWAMPIPNWAPNSSLDDDLDEEDEAAFAAFEALGLEFMDLGPEGTNGAEQGDGPVDGTLCDACTIRFA